MATPRTPRKRVNKAETAKDETDTAAMHDDSTPVDDVVPAMDEPESLSTTEPSDTDANDPVEPPPEPALTEKTDPAPEAKPVSSVPEVKQERPKPTPQPAPQPVQQIVKSGPGFVPLVLGGVVAAGIGFGLARYAVPEGWPFPGTSPLQTQIAEQAAEIAALREELQAAPKIDPAEIEAIRKTAASALETAQNAETVANQVPESTEDLIKRVATLETRGPATSGSNSATIDMVLTDIAALKSGLAEQRAEAEALMQAAETAKAQALAEAQTQLLKAALSRVEAAMQNGLPFVDELQMLADAGLVIPDILTSTAKDGLPTRTALEQGFAAPARAALKQTLRNNMGSTWAERAGSFLRSQTGARSLTPQEGDDPDAILSRADAALANGDFETALAEIAALPEPAQDILADWVAQVKLRHDAQTATAQLAAALSER